MIVYRGIEQLPAFDHSVLTIGTFDGVHQGHQRILSTVVKAAQSIGGTSILITFEPHPRKLIFPNQSLHLLTSLEERLSLVAETGIDVTVVVPFTVSFAALSAEDYVQDFLVRYFRPQLIVIGYDHRFGHDRTGDLQMLNNLAHQNNYAVREISAQLIEQAAVSSTKVRRALEEGRVELAANMLGRPFLLSAEVIEGVKLGRKIGFPTANLGHWNADKVIPQKGVYAVEALVGNVKLKGMLNIGTNPTVTQDQLLKIEVHLFDFDQDIYQQPIQVAFVARIRDEQRFDHIDQLKAQLAQDKSNALKLLS